MKAYFIPGLGADQRVFKNLQLPPGYEPAYLEWLPPGPKESLKQYARRMAGFINETGEFVLIGLSFGGMLATEISRIIIPAQLILISSIASSSELPGYYRVASKMHLQDLVPVSFFKSAAILKRIFTAETPEEKAMLREMIRGVDPAFIHWALNAILSWEDTVPARAYIHIHGTADELLPYKYTHATHAIKKGGHMMVMNRAAEINTILEQVLPQAEVSN